MFSEVFQMDKILGFVKAVVCDWSEPFVSALQPSGAPVFPLCGSLPGAHLPAILPVVHGSCGAGALRPVLHHERLLSKTETGVWRDYRKAYRDDWGQKYLLAAGHMFLILVFEINIEFFAVQIPVFPLMILFVILFAVRLGGDTESVPAGLPVPDEEPGYC